MSQYFISHEASQDLDEILDYFLSHNVEAGERFVKAFNKKCQHLARFPNIGRSYDDVALGLRGIPIQGYILLYTLRDDDIIIVRIISGYRDLDSLFAESDQ